MISVKNEKAGAYKTHSSAKSLKQILIKWLILLWTYQTWPVAFLRESTVNLISGRSPDLFPVLSPSHPEKQNSGIIDKTVVFILKDRIYSCATARDLHTIPF